MPPPPPGVAHDLTSHSRGPHSSMTLASVVLSHALILLVQTDSPLLSILTSALTLASTSQSLDRWRGGQEPVTIETSAAACSVAYLLLYELKQGASIHILAREVREAAEDKGIGRSKKGVVVVLVRMG